jgi:hypothetical protein
MKVKEVFIDAGVHAEKNQSATFFCWTKKLPNGQGFVLFQYEKNFEFNMSNKSKQTEKLKNGQSFVCFDRNKQEFSL